ncbi:tumor protein p53-inducible protein 13 isoform X2 [Pleurodeles waltl]|uniref:tumor protein p53-inducible protein 13 isoform X2 n=1 Tax=Pleurodeles waltl TaxID=8319 RepID=UPI003709735B
MRLVLAGLAIYLAAASLCRAVCDDAKVIPQLARQYPAQEAHLYCIDQEIKYNLSIPNSGPSRPRRARYGEYKFCPPQRWVHNLQHGAVAFLYHPCVNPALKEDLCLFARTYYYKHIITPHVGLTKERPLALASWAATLEMQQINVTEALTWLHENTRHTSKYGHKGNTYDYLLIRPAMVQMLKKSFNLPQDIAVTKERSREVKRLTIIRNKMMKRKRAVPPDPVTNRGFLNNVSTSDPPRERHEGRPGDDVGVSEAAVPTTQSNSLVHKHPPASINHPMSLDDGVRQEVGSPRSTGGWGIDSKPKGMQFVSEDSEQEGVRLEETKNATAVPREAQNNKDIQSKEESRRSAVKQSGYTGNSTNDSAEIRSRDSFSDSKEQEKTAGQKYNGTEGSSQGTAPVPHNVMSLQMTSPTQLSPIGNLHEKVDIRERGSNLQTSQKSGLVTVNVSVPMAESMDSSQNHASSESDKERETGNSSNLVRHEGQGLAIDDGHSSTPSKDVKDGASKLEVPDSRNSSTMSTKVVEKDEGRSAKKEQCNCPVGSSDNHQALAQAGVLGSTKHIQSGHEVPRAAVDMFVRTPRTEEAAWAAAALTFLFVLLTLAVLYTRLWRKFRKSESLYWAPDSDHEGQETVSAVIKRRLTVGQARRKKRQTYKKRPLVFYENLSDSSDSACE